MIPSEVTTDDFGYKVFVQPGCSSCLRTKEFLAKHGIVHRVVDVINDPGGMNELLALGVRHIPVVAMGKNFVFGQNVEDVAKFVGVHLVSIRRLPAEELIKRWIDVLSVAQVYVRQLPDSCMEQEAFPGRPGTICDLGYHLFRIGEAFLDTTERGVEQWIDNSMQPAPVGRRSQEAVAGYGEIIKRRLSDWWGRQETAIADRKVKTFQGLQSLHWFLERQTWHSTQHTRQMADVLYRNGISPSPVLGPDLLKDLPLPERIWV